MAARTRRRHPLVPVFRQHPLDDLGPLLWVRVGQEVVDFERCRRDAAQVEAGTAEEHQVVRLLGPLWMRRGRGTGGRGWLVVRTGAQGRGGGETGACQVGEG